MEVSSPLVISPARCIHVGICGGCSFQHISYQEQLHSKEDEIRTLFTPFPEACLLPILPAEEPWHYRGKMEFTFSQDRAGKRFLGLLGRGARGKVVSLTECHIGPRKAAELLERMREWWERSGLEAFHLRKATGSLRTLTLRASSRTGCSLVMLTVSGDPLYALSRDQMDQFVLAVQEVLGPTTAIFLRIHQALKGQPTEMFEMHLAGPKHLDEILELPPITGRALLHCKISPSSFFQPHPLQAERMVGEAARMLALKPSDRLWDLYCGTFTFGLSLSALVKEVVGIELQPEAVLDAEENIALNGITNARIHAGDVASLLVEMKGEAPDAVLVDPPRVGLAPAALEELLRISPEKILYISCNPATQLRDALQIAAAGYRLLQLQPIDQFPHTRHLENLALFIKIGETGAVVSRG